MKQFRTKVVTPDFDNMSKGHQEEKNLNKQFEVEIKEQIKLWSESLPPNKSSDLKTEAKIESTSTAPVQRITLISWKEQRVITKLIENFNKRPHSEITIEANNIWGPVVKLTDPKGRNPIGQNFFIKGSEETITCTSGCEGSGKFTCKVCNGHTKCKCQKCNGAGLLKCRVCKGDGETSRTVETQEIFEGHTTGKKRLENTFKNVKSTCLNCRGTKQETCTGCMGRKVIDCTNCHSGVVSCKGCNGSGSQKVYTQLSVTFIPTVKTVLFYPLSHANLKTEDLPTLTDADYVTLISESVEPATWKSNEMWTKIPVDKIQSIQKIISSSDYSSANNNEKFAGLHLNFEQAPCLHAIYQYKNESFHLWFAGLGQRMIAEDSPFRREAEVLTKEIEVELHKNIIVNQIPKIAFLMELSSNSIKVQETYTNVLKNIYDNVDNASFRENHRFNLATSFQLFQIKKALHFAATASSWNENSRWYSDDPQTLRNIFKVTMFALTIGLSFFIINNFKNLFQSANAQSINSDMFNSLLVGSLVLAYLLGGVTWNALLSLRKGNDLLWKSSVVGLGLISGGLWFYGLTEGEWVASLVSLIIIVILAKFIPDWHMKAEKQKIELPNPSDKIAFLKSLHELVFPYQRFANSHYSAMAMSQVPIETKTEMEVQRATLQEAAQAEKNRVAKSLTDSLKK